MKSILIIDDNQPVLRSLSRALRREFVVTCCSSVEDALDLVASKHTYDAVLCDLNFDGGASGRHFYERTLALAPELTDRILIMSGASPEEGDPLAHRFVDKTNAVDELRKRIDGFRVPTRAA